MISRALIAAGLVLWLAGCSDSEAPAQQESAAKPATSSEPAKPVPLEFVGSNQCADCHANEMASWRGSHHDQAMLTATADNVVGNFDNATHTYAGVTSTFFRKDDAFWVRTDNKKGELQDFPIAYTFGIEPLQQYLIEFPGGRLQALNVVWDDRPADAGGQQWVHLYPDEAIGHQDPLHWTGDYQNWNFMCSECHSTNLEKRYRTADNSFDTRWSEINVACEACHGPGSRHVDWANSGEDGYNYRNQGMVASLAEDDGHSWTMDLDRGIAHRTPALRGSQRQPEACGRCHARRSQLTEDYRYNKHLLDTHLPALLTPDLYHADGQILEEVYVYGSFLQSKMHAAGVTCSDCHDPHSLELKAEGNAMCGSCHLPTRFDVTEHHKHATEQVQCVDCHMTSKNYMVVDARRDHSFRIPRPDLTMKLKTPNACNQCHADQTAKWAADQVAAWYPEGQWTTAHYAEAFAAARNDASDGLRRLEILAADQSQPAIVRATALSDMGPRLQPPYQPAVAQGLTDSDPLVRLGAISATTRLPPEAKASMLGPLLEDPIMGIRVSAVGELATARQALQPRWHAAFDAAAREYIQAQEASAERPEAQVNLGNFYLAMGELGNAERAFHRALFLNPNAVPAMVNLADLYRETGRDGQAETLLRDGLNRVGDNAALEHTLGLTLVRSQRAAEAMNHLEAAATLDPENARYRYVYGVALNSTGESAKALQVLEEAHQAFPADVEILWALVTMNRDAGNTEAMRTYAKKILELNPGNAGAAQLLRQLPSPPSP